MHCPFCEAENGAATEVAERGYQCNTCGRWPNSTWWYRFERTREIDLGSAFDRYQIGARVGSDHNAWTYDAMRSDTGAPVQLRIYRPWLEHVPEFVERFTRTQAVHHTLGAHAVPVENAGRTAGLYFVATEPVAGPRLIALLGKRVAWPDAHAVLVSLCRLYAKAHEAGIALAMQPAKIFLTMLPPADVLDGDPYRTAAALGRPRLASVDIYGHTLGVPWRIAESETGVHHPSPSFDYTSPEGLMGKRVDTWSDVYALGLVGFELLTGRKPFPDAHGPAGLITAQLKQRPPPPSQLVPDLPTGFDAVIARCLEKHPAQRFAASGELLAALEQLATPP